MTICIAAIAENGSKLVAASDKMITYSSPPYHLFEHPRPKIDMLNRRCIIMTAGSALLPSEYKRIIRKKLEVGESEARLVRDIAECACKAYEELRRSEIEMRILRKYGVHWDEYIRRISGEGLSEFYYRLISQIEDFQLDLVAIIAGIDGEGAHIFLVENPGELSCFDDIGYTAIGTGEYHAIRSFIEHSYSINFPLVKALYVVFEAKKYAEAAPGVGKATEIVIVDEMGIKRINNDIIRNLEDVYGEKIQFSSQIIREKIEPLLDEIKVKLT
ncbi:MAG: hypothetical protein NDF54_09450 [archaeon GB-1867-035]|nr:hypothetical protein [Candidatus Culexmicrobium profundum]